MVRFLIRATLEVQRLFRSGVSSASLIRERLLSEARFLLEKIWSLILRKPIF